MTADQIFLVYLVPIIYLAVGYYLYHRTAQEEEER
jgi:cbb3-type cytochrome oxidase subunit 3